MKSLLLIAVILSVAFGSFISYSSDKNITVNNQDFTYRETQSQLINLPGIYEALFFSSLSVSAGNGSQSSDGLFGAAYAGNGIPPTAYLAFYHSAAMWSNTNNVMNSDVTLSDGFIGKSFVSLEEVNANGTTVNRVNFDALQWTTGGSSVGKGGLNYFTLTSTQRQTGLNVNITFIISDVSGVLNVTGQPIITPKSLETIIQVNNYTYKSTGNSLQLTIAVGSGEVNSEVMGTFTSGNGTSQTYFSLQGVADIDGKVKTVNISGFVKGNSNNMNNNLAGQVTAKYARAANFQLVTVSFPAGANSITYDPVIGSGSMPQDTTTTTNAGVSGTNAGSNPASGSQGQDNAATFAVVPTLLLLSLIKMIL